MLLLGDKRGRAALVWDLHVPGAEQGPRAGLASRSRGAWPGTWETQFLGWEWPHQEGVPSNL